MEKVVIVTTSSYISPSMVYYDMHIKLDIGRRKDIYIPHQTARFDKVQISTKKCVWMKEIVEVCIK